MTNRAQLERLRFYGKLNTVNLPSAVYQIWLTREHELEPCEAVPLLQCQLDDDPLDRHEIVQAGARAWELASECLTPREFRVLTLRFRMGLTLEETGLAIGESGQRARIYESKALRKLRNPDKLGSVGLEQAWRWL